MDHLGSNEWDDVPLFGDAYARTGDPWTSHLAAMKAGKGSRQLFREIMALPGLREQPSTMESVGSALRSRGIGNAFSSIRSRICDLTRAGMLTVVDSEGATSLGNKCRRFTMTERGRSFEAIDNAVDPIALKNLKATRDATEQEIPTSDLLDVIRSLDDLTVALNTTSPEIRQRIYNIRRSVWDLGKR